MKVFVSCDLPGHALKRLKAQCEVTVNSKGQLTPQQLAQEAKGYDGIITMLSDIVDESVIQTLKDQLKVIANYAVGYNNIDVDCATKWGIYVANTPDVLTNATAEVAIALMFACARKVVQSDKLVRNGEFAGWKPDLMLGQDVFGKKLGVIGAGRIGRRVLCAARGLGMEIYYHNRQQNLEAEQLGAKYVSLKELLGECDYISIHCPLTDQTYHLIGKTELEMMKKTAILINTARGPVVDEKALCEALQNGEILSAGLDVYEREPQVEPQLLTMENVVLLPHIGSATYATREKMADMVVDAVLSGIKGECPQNAVNVVQR